jgi:hypothetical protein
MKIMTIFLGLSALLFVQGGSLTAQIPASELPPQVPFTARLSRLSA